MRWIRLLKGTLTGLLVILVTASAARAGAPAALIDRGDGACRQLALTFDTEFSPTVTAELLDVLAANDATGTFFLVGQGVVKYPVLTRRIAASHEVANWGQP